jgi:hypothetical protein
MSTPIIDTIVRTDFYVLRKKADTILVTGDEIIKGVFHSRLSKDTIISIDPSAFYKVQDTLICSGSKLLESITAIKPIIENPFLTVMAWGAGFLGFVIGWNLYLINRHRDKTQVTIGDITVIVGALANGALLIFFDNSTRLLGWYGVGLGIGFLVYGLILFILIKLTASSESPLPLAFFKLHTGQFLDARTIKKQDDEN